MSNKIPTAEELFNQHSNLYQFEEGDPEYLVDKEDFKRSVIEFAKLHVEAALQKALEETYCDMYGDVVRESVIESYPLSNIK